MKTIFSLVLLTVTSLSWAAAPVCYVHAPGNYCQYTGLVSTIYVNDSNLILIYFDQPVDPGYVAGFGINISKGAAAAYRVSDNPEFAKLFYSTALAAQASGRDITMQLRGEVGGYLKFDRIWLYAP
jgi:hypothetical protein